MVEHHNTSWRTFLAIWAGIALVLLGLVPRFLGLDAKPAMHDESMFAFYAWQGMQPGAHYIHQAILHGPVQMLGIGWFFHLFGDTLGVARAFIACCSVLMLLAGLWLVPTRLRWWFAPLWITSPIIIYYSRYLHEELIFNGAFCLGMLGVARGFRRNWVGTLGLLLALIGLLLLVGRPGIASTALCSLLLLGAAICGLTGVRRNLCAALWALLAPIALFFPLAVKENALFIYAAALTFMLAWILIQLLWHAPAPALHTAPPRRAPLPPGTKPPEAKATRTDPKPAGGRGRKYMHRSFEEVVGDDVPGAPSLNPAAAHSDPHASTRRPCRACPLPAWATVLIWTLGIFLGIGLVCWIYGITRADSAPGWSPRQIFSGALLNMRDSWNYWLEQHELHRIEGPIDYYVPILLIYELPALLLLGLGLAWDATRRRGRLAAYITGFAVWLLIFGLWQLINPHLNSTSLISKITGFLHIRPNAQMLLLGALVAPLVVWSLLCLKQHRLLPAWLGWWAACSLFQYSSAGEKVPWLAVNIIVPLYLMLPWVWAPHYKHLARWGRWSLGAVLLVGTLIALRNDYYLVRVPEQIAGNTVRYAADPRERLVYNHTPLEFDQFCRKMLSNWQLSEQTIPLSKRRVLLAGGPSWPGVWYFRHCGYVLSAAPVAPLDPTYDLILGDQSLVEPALRDLDLGEWVPQQLSLRNHWMVVWPTENQWPRWSNYYWTRAIWPPDPVTWPVTALYPMRTRR